MNATRVAEVVHIKTEDDLTVAVQRAKRLGKRISIGGAKHSQGGHAFYKDSIHLDMSGFNAILALDEHAKTIRVQSGATWAQIQDHVNSHRLSVKVMQSSNIFTVGGSLSANVHGRDPNFGPIIETVRSFRLLTSDGAILNVSRDENAELFRLAIGGFGLFGVIVDAELSLTDDIVYSKHTIPVTYSEYVDYFEDNVKTSPYTGLHFGRLSITPDGLLRDGYVVTYLETDERPADVFELTDEKNVRINRFAFTLSRNYDWGKRFRWSAQRLLVDDMSITPAISRNNAMRPPIAFLEHDSDENADILQEYFIPPVHFEDFIDALRDIVNEDAINLLNVTVRYVPENNEAFLSYARNECFAVVLYINQELSEEGVEHARNWTRRLVDAAHEHDGIFYLVYQRYPTRKQLLTHYPNFDEFVEKKKQYDPSELFMNTFYERYASAG